MQELNNDTRNMESLETAPDVVLLSEAHRWLPMSRSTVYEAAKAGQIQVRRLPMRRYVTKAELRRLRGEEEPGPAPIIQERPRYSYPRARRSRGRS